MNKIILSILFQVFKLGFQFLLSSFFVFTDIVILNPRGSMGTQILFMLITLPFAITIGILLGDISLHKTKICSILAIVSSLILSVIGIILFLFSADLSHVIPEKISYIASFGVLVVPPLVGYNWFSHLKRRKVQAIVKAEE